MKKQKRILSLTLALVMALALLPTAAMAANITVTEVVPVGKYAAIGDFSDGLAAVRSENSWGFIDKTGNEVVPCTLEYDRVEDFFEGLAVVVVGEYPYKRGFIDKTGKEVVPCKYEEVKDFSEGLAAVAVYLNGKWGFVDKTGTEVIPCKYDSVRDFSDGLAAVCAGEQFNKKWGFIDKTGTEVIPCKYDSVRDFSDGLAVVCIEEYPDKKWGFIDKTGKEVVPFGKYNSVQDFSEGLAAVELDGKWGFIDKTGNEVVPCKYGTVKGFSDEFAAVGIYSGKTDWMGVGLYTWGFIDKTGKEVVPPKYGKVENFSAGLAAVALTTNEKDEHNDAIYKWGYIDSTGTEVIPCQYSRAGNFSDGLAAVCMGRNFHAKWGFIDKTGKEVVPCKYKEVKGFSEGLAVVQDENWKISVLAIDGYTGTSTIPATNTAYASTQTVNVDGKAVTFECYALKDADGNATNYIKLRDLAVLLNGSAAQFQVGWDGSVTITTKTAYTSNGSELSTPYSGDRAYQETNAATKVNGQNVDLAAFMLTDDKGGGYTYYQLRDLGKALGFNVGWAADKGIFVETAKPYDANN